MLTQLVKGLQGSTIATIIILLLVIALVVVKIVNYKNSQSHEDEADIVDPYTAQTTSEINNSQGYIDNDIQLLDIKYIDPPVNSLVKIES